MYEITEHLNEIAGLSFLRFEFASTADELLAKDFRAYTLGMHSEFRRCCSIFSDPSACKKPYP